MAASRCFFSDSRTVGQWYATGIGKTNTQHPNVGMGPNASPPWRLGPAQQPKPRESCSPWRYGPVNDFPTRNKTQRWSITPKAPRESLFVGVFPIKFTDSNCLHPFPTRKRSRPRLHKGTAIASGDILLHACFRPTCLLAEKCSPHLFCVRET